MKKIIFITVLALSMVACGDRIKPDDSGDGSGSVSDGLSGATAGSIESVSLPRL